MQQNKTKYYVIGIVLISLIIAVIYSFDMKEVWQQKGIYFPALLLICGGILYNSHFVVKAIRALEFTEKYQNKVSGFTKLALTVGALLFTSITLTLNPDLSTTNVAEGLNNMIIIIRFVIAFYIFTPLALILTTIITKFGNTYLSKPSGN